MSKKILSASVVILFFMGVYPCAAQPTRFESLDNFPYVFLSSLSTKNTTQDQYVNQVTEIVFKHSKSKNSFSHVDFDRALSEAEYKIKRHNVSGMLVHDRNFDAFVTEEEIREFYEGIEHHPSQNVSEEMSKKWAKKQAALEMRMDVDGDGKISMSEMSLLSDQEKERIRNMLGYLLTALETDPDKDGVITKDEWQALAKKVFSVADENADGILDDEELMAIQVYKNKRRLKDRLSSAPSKSPE